VELSRRDALKLGGLSILGVAALGTPLGGGAQTKAASRLSAADFPKRYAAEITKQPALAAKMVDGVAHYDITLKRNPGANVLGGRLTTPVFGYEGVFPGPRIEVDRGTPAVVRFRNHLDAVGPFGSPARTSTHLHGSASLPEYDGYANDTTPVGSYKDYQYPNFQPARTLWYHDHGVHWTAQQAYGGLAAMYLMHDREEQHLLPKGDFDIPLMVNDAIFGADGQLLYEDNSHSGLWGDVILVNGKPWPVMKVQRRTYRFRILNCSIARSFTWRLSNGMPLQVVATDGGLMPKGVAVTSMRHAGAERYEIVIDFSKVPATTKRIELLNGSNKNNVDYDYTGKVMAFDLLDGPVTKTRARYDDPTVLEPDPTWDRNYDGFKLVDSEIMSLPTSGDYKRRHFKLRRDDITQQFMIDDTSWEEVVDSEYTKVLADPDLGDTEIWELENSSGGWFHPVHVHLVDFRVIKRVGGPGKVLPYEQGPKDVVYVGEGETVTLLVKFNAPGGDPEFEGGRYMVHCHNLPHEDHDMMGQFSIGEVDLDGWDPHHPMSAAKPVPDPSYVPPSP
jgi:FtsP/CotA-like multicopper oxidase with cupredoxin domain